MKIRPRPFILLEVFLGVLILSLALIPLISFPFYLQRTDYKNLCELELTRQVDVAFAWVLKDMQNRPRLPKELEGGLFEITLPKCIEVNLPKQNPIQYQVKSCLQKLNSFKRDDKKIVGDLPPGADLFEITLTFETKDLKKAPTIQSVKYIFCLPWKKEAEENPFINNLVEK